MWFEPNHLGCLGGSVGRATALKAVGHGFESHLSRFCFYEKRKQASQVQCLVYHGSLRSHVCIHACTHTHTHTDTHVHAHSHSHTHTRTLTLNLNFSLSSLPPSLLQKPLPPLEPHVVEDIASLLRSHTHSVSGDAYHFMYQLFTSTHTLVMWQTHWSHASDCDILHPCSCDIHPLIIIMIWSYNIVIPYKVTINCGYILILVFLYWEFWA